MFQSADKICKKIFCLYLTFMKSATAKLSSSAETWERRQIRFPRRNGYDRSNQKPQNYFKFSSYFDKVEHTNAPQLNRASQKV